MSQVFMEVTDSEGKVHGFDRSALVFYREADRTEYRAGFPEVIPGVTLNFTGGVWMFIPMPIADFRTALAEIEHVDIDWDEMLKGLDASSS